MQESNPKKTTTLNSRVPDTLKSDFKRALKKVGFTEAFFLRSVAEAMIHFSTSGDDLSLPIRLLTVQERERRKKSK